MTKHPRPIDEISARIETMLALPDDALAASAAERAEELLAFGEDILGNWVIAHGKMPTDDTVEGFRLLALQRQGARGDPSFNACRETCRELVYYRNLVGLTPNRPNAVYALRLGAMVARHLVLFISGKLEVAGLGEFCCSSRPLREGDAGVSASRQ